MKLLPFASSARILSRSLLLVSTILAPCQAQVADEVDWKSFLARHDMVWQRLPDRFESAAFTGNGHLGAMVFTTGGGKSLKWQMGRSDVAFSSSRIPIGDLVLTPRGRILSGEMRLDLWNAEIRGSLTTDKGRIEFRSFTHSDQMVNVFETMAKGGEQAAWSWSPGLASDPRKIHKKEALTEKDTNAAPVPGVEGDIAFGFQPLKPGGGHTTAWKTVDSGNGRSVVYAGVGYANQEAPSKSEAINAVRKAAETGVPSLAASHRAWWRRFWPQSFVSVPDTRLESFYFIF